MIPLNERDVKNNELIKNLIDFEKEIIN